MKAATEHALDRAPSPETIDAYVAARRGNQTARARELHRKLRECDRYEALGAIYEGVTLLTVSALRVQGGPVQRATMHYDQVPTYERMIAWLSQAWQGAREEWEIGVYADASSHEVGSYRLAFPHDEARRQAYRRQSALREATDGLHAMGEQIGRYLSDLQRLGLLSPVQQVTLEAAIASVRSAEHHLRPLPPPSSTP
ncbi:MAG: hypothetical protein IT477_10455 [Rhodanobacteraceae bacterium]|nr:hypothetical protein [Rhodanobacteraceae bacterium]